MSVCLACRRGRVAPLLDLGPQPVCNRYLPAPDAAEARFPLRIGQCDACALVQNRSPLSASELRPRYEWITYNEPEGHLDALADAIAALPGVRPDSLLFGVSFKDDTLLRRLRERGLPRTWRPDPRADLEVAGCGAGVETVQDRLTLERAERLGRRHGRADIVVARHIWEHAADPPAFLLALGALLAPEGHLVLEVPDCERALAACDYSTVWEEHTLYFTSATFWRALATSRLSAVSCASYPYLLEDSLVAIARRGADLTDEPGGAWQAEERTRAERFAAELPARRQRMRLGLERHRRHGRIALLGAGHLACTFINLLQLDDLIDCLVDDDPRKVGLYMPGSHLPIHDSGALLERRITLCLMSVNPESEERVMQRNAAFLGAGGSFASIFPASRRALTP